MANYQEIVLAKLHENRLGIDILMNEKLIWLTSCSSGIDKLHI